MQLTLRRLSMATLVGYAEMLQILGYILDVSPMIFLAAAVAIKAVCAILSAATPRLPTPGIRFAILLVGLSMFSMVVSPYKDAETAAQLIGFGASITLTLYLVAGDRALRDYGRALVNAVCLASVLYVLFAITGRIDTFYGRYMYFSHTHPNLGSEIGAIAIIVACMVFERGQLLVRIAILFPPLVMMQGRAALLASLLAIGIRGISAYRLMYRRYPGVVVAITCLVAPVAAVAMSSMVISLFRAMLMLDDEHRGVGTGFVGRSDRWQTSVDLFLDHPFIGNGPAVYDVLGIFHAHNFFLAGFASLGLTFLVILWFIAVHARRAARQHGRTVAILLPVVVLMFFNDRFINMAPYPFVAYVFLLTLSAPIAAAESASAALPAPWRTPPPGAALPAIRA